MINLWAVQQAIYTALAVAPATYPAYDAVPQNTAQPYIVIGEITMQPDGELDDDSADASLQIHAWSRYAGKSQVHAMLAFIRARLDNHDVGTASGVWALSEDFSEIMEDPASTAASRLYHGVSRYRVRAN